ncbi:MAG: hypothetical protein ACOX42_10980 [Clostridia bacterium]
MAKSYRGLVTRIKPKLLAYNRYCINKLLTRDINVSRNKKLVFG